MGRQTTFSPLRQNRIIGYDTARGIALAAMLLINFKAVLSPLQTSPVWLSAAIDLMDRRAAVILVMVAGAGLSLFCRGPGRSRRLLKRALFLLIAGYLLSAAWSGDILHFYGVYIGIGVLLTSLPNGCLLTAGMMFWAGSWIPFSHGFEWVPENAGTSFLLDQAADLLFTGFYPVFPWMAFFVAGMWLGRRDPDSGDGETMLLAIGILLFCIGELLSGASDRIPARWTGSALGSSLAAAMGLGLDQASPLAAVSAFGTGLTVIILCLSPLGSRPAAFLVTIGRTALTLYILHIILLCAGSRIPALSSGLPILSAAGGAVLFLLVYSRIMHLWISRFSNGPLEIMLRRFLVFKRALPVTNISPFTPTSGVMKHARRLT